MTKLIGRLCETFTMVLLLVCVALTVAVYALSRILAKRHASPFTTPVFFSTAVIIAVLYISGLNYQDYAPAKDLMVLLLGPATVASLFPYLQIVTP
jgi:putative effector of murein hydrolase